MLDMYVALVIAHRRTTIAGGDPKIPLVPASWRQAVNEDLAAIGLDGNGNPV